MHDTVCVPPLAMVITVLLFRTVLLKPPGDSVYFCVIAVCREQIDLRILIDLSFFKNQSNKKGRFHSSLVNLPSAYPSLSVLRSLWQVLLWQPQHLGSEVCVPLPDRPLISASSTRLFWLCSYCQSDTRRGPNEHFDMTLWFRVLSGTFATHRMTSLTIDRQLQMKPISDELEIR